MGWMCKKVCDCAAVLPLSLLCLSAQALPSMCLLSVGYTGHVGSLYLSFTLGGALLRAHYRHEAGCGDTSFLSAPRCLCILNAAEIFCMWVPSSLIIHSLNSLIIHPIYTWLVNTLFLNQFLFETLLVPSMLDYKQLGIKVKAHCTTQNRMACALAELLRCGSCQGR